MDNKIYENLQKYTKDTQDLFAPIIEFLNFDDGFFAQVGQGVLDTILEFQKSLDFQKSVQILIEDPDFSPEAVLSILNDIEKVLLEDKSEVKKNFFRTIFTSMYEEIISYVNGTKEFYDIEVPIQLFEGGQIPIYANPTDDGADIYAKEDFIIPAKSFGTLIPSGFATALPRGWKITIKPRSGISKNTHLRISNSPGTIDSAFRSEIGVLLDNYGEEYTIKKGERFAQLAIEPSYKARFNIVENVKVIGEDRGGGFGSSGK